MLLYITDVVVRFASTFGIKPEISYPPFQFDLANLMLHAHLFFPNISIQ